MKRFVILVSVEGILVQCWLDKACRITEDLEEAAEFVAVDQAVEWLAEWLGDYDGEADILGTEVRFKGLCSPNPC